MFNQVFFYVVSFTKVGLPTVSTLQLRLRVLVYNQVQRKSATFVLQFFVFLFVPFILEDFFTYQFPTLTPFLLKLSKNNFGNIFICIVNSRDFFFHVFCF